MAHHGGKKHHGVHEGDQVKPLHPPMPHELNSSTLNTLYTGMYSQSANFADIAKEYLFVKFEQELRERAAAKKIVPFGINAALESSYQIMSIIFKKYDKRGDLKYEKEEDFEPVSYFRDSYIPKVAPIIKEAPYLIGGGKTLGNAHSSGILNHLADDQRSFRTRKSGHEGSPHPPASSVRGSPQ